MARRGREQGGNGSSSTEPQRLFAEVVGGLEDLAERELLTLGATALEPARSGLRLTHPHPYELCREARLVVAIYRELRFAVPRPKALLGDAALRRLAAALSEVAASAGISDFRFAAAGSDSAVFQRLATELSSATGLRHDTREGGLLLRVRPYGEEVGRRSERAAPSDGWEALLRLTPRPLTTRPWRVCNRPGGVNAAVAVAMNQLLEPAPGNAYLNLMCGSGTLLVERALSAGARRLVGVDLEEEALDCARTNLTAAGVADFELHSGDVATLGEALNAAGTAAPDWTTAAQATFDELAADAPWGDAVGDHAANLELYPALLGSAARLATPGARFALLSHEVRLLERLLPQHGDWQVLSARRLAHGGHRPVLMLLKRV